MVKYSKYFMKEDFKSKEYIEVSANENENYQIKEIKGNILEVFPLCPIDNYEGSPKKWRETMLKLNKEERSSFLFRTLGFDHYVDSEKYCHGKFSISDAIKLGYKVELNGVVIYEDPAEKITNPLDLLNFMYEDCKKKNEGK